MSVKVDGAVMRSGKNKFEKTSQGKKTKVKVETVVALVPWQTNGEEEPKDIEDATKRIARWMSRVTNRWVNEESLCEDLMDGTALCLLLHRVYDSGQVLFYELPKKRSEAIENVETFLNACDNLGLEQSFTYEDLRQKNVTVVVEALTSLAKEIDGRFWYRMKPASVISSLSEDRVLVPYDDEDSEAEAGEQGEEEDLQVVVSPSRDRRAKVVASTKGDRKSPAMKSATEMPQESPKTSSKTKSRKPASPASQMSSVATQSPVAKALTKKASPKIGGKKLEVEQPAESPVSRSSARGNPSPAKKVAREMVQEPLHKSTEKTLKKSPKSPAQVGNSAKKNATVPELPPARNERSPAVRGERAEQVTPTRKVAALVRDEQQAKVTRKLPAKNTPPINKFCTDSVKRSKVVSPGKKTSQKKKQLVVETVDSEEDTENSEEELEEQVEGDEDEEQEEEEEDDEEEDDEEEEDESDQDQQVEGETDSNEEDDIEEDQKEAPSRVQATPNQVTAVPPKTTPSKVTMVITKEELLNSSSEGSSDSESGESGSELDASDASSVMSSSSSLSSISGDSDSVQVVFDESKKGDSKKERSPSMVSGSPSVKSSKSGKSTASKHRKQQKAAALSLVMALLGLFMMFSAATGTIVIAEIIGLFNLGIAESFGIIEPEPKMWFFK